MKLSRGLLLLTILIGGLRVNALPADSMTEELEAKITKLVETSSWDEVAAELEPWLRSGQSEIWAHVGFARALANLEREAEAAHHFDKALELMAVAGTDKGKEYRMLRDEQGLVDPFAGRRRVLFKKIATKLKDCVEGLITDGHDAQALALLERIEESLAGTSEKDIQFRDLLERLRVANEEVDLDAEGSAERLDGDRPLVDYISKRYRLQCNLEEDVAHAVGDTMDDIFMSYVQIYLDGDQSRIPDAKATIRIHGSWDQMVKYYPGQEYTPGLGGWWSPSENKVTNYDTRERSGSLDEMLGTLFHEASHQFMTALSKRGGYSPAWLNEGTASFFEGAKAMQDHRVLWPDVAQSRLYSLARFLGGSPGGPTVEEVIGYDKPGSYPGEYYCYGWGLVYFFQEFEDPKTLAYVWRPYYQEYLQKVTTEGGHPRKLFDEIFLRPGNPGNFTSFSDFENTFRDWILKTVYPMYSGNQGRNLRKKRIDNYLVAAEKAKSQRIAGVTEKSILERALRDLEFIRTEIDREDIPDGDIIMLEADVLGRLDRDGAEAHMIQIVLDLIDDGTWDGLDDNGYEDLTDRLGKINKSYRSLSLVRNRTRSLRKDAAELLTVYLDDGNYDMRAYTFAAKAAELLRDPYLREESNRLRADVGQNGGLSGSIDPLEGAKWLRIFPKMASEFTHTAKQVAIEMETGPNGMICSDIEVLGEYELRGKLIREGEMAIGTVHGLVASGTPDGDWTVVGIDHNGKLSILQCMPDRIAVKITKIDLDENLSEPLEEGHNPNIRVHVYPSGFLDIYIDDQEMIEVELPYEMPAVAHPGIFTKSGRTILRDMVIENYP
jgi:hypothetical protein